MAPPQATLRRVSWSSAVRRHLGRVEGTAPHRSLDWFKSEIEDGRLIAWGLHIGRRLAGVIVGRFAEGDKGMELHVTKAGGFGGGVRVMRSAMAALIGFAREQGCLSVRFDTGRAGLLRAMAPLGFKPVAITLRVVFDDLR